MLRRFVYWVLRHLCRGGPIVAPGNASGANALFDSDQPDHAALCVRVTRNPLVALWWRICSCVVKQDVAIASSLVVPSQRGALALRRIPAGAVFPNDPFREHMNDGAMDFVPPELQAMLVDTGNPISLLLAGLAGLLSRPRHVTEARVRVEGFLRDTPTEQWRAHFRRYRSVERVRARVNCRTVAATASGRVYQQALRDILPGEELLTYYTLVFWIHQLAQAVGQLPIPDAAGGTLTASRVLTQDEKLRLPLMQYLEREFRPSGSAERKMFEDVCALWRDAQRWASLALDAPIG